MSVKRGDLAITTHSKIEGNTGILVEALKFIGRRDKHDHRADWWLVRVLGSPKRTAAGNLTTEGHFPDQYLRPVSGLPDTESTDEQVTKPVNIPEAA